MSTNSYLIIKRSDGKATSQYIHWDGATHLPLLRKNYNTQELADKLSALGDLSVLDKSAECPEGHSFDTPVKGYCIAYGRDRGEENVASKVYDSIEDAQNDDYCVSYIYTWNGKAWSKN